MAGGKWANSGKILFSAGCIEMAQKVGIGSTITLTWNVHFGDYCTFKRKSGRKVG